MEMHSEYKKNLKNFIEKSKAFYKTIPMNDDWESLMWDTKNWLPHRGLGNNLIFKAHICKSNDPKYLMTKEFADFSKSIILQIYKVKKIGFGQIKRYLYTLRMLYTILLQRDEVSPLKLTRWHFDELINNMLTDNVYISTIYSKSSTLETIAKFIDNLKIIPNPIQYKNNIKYERGVAKYLDSPNLEDRLGNNHLPSYEAILAYAKCTNSPINDNEKILLRTIDLIIATGLRVNEILLLPYNCLGKKARKNKTDNVATDSENQNNYDFYLKYYAEKKFRPQIHWLSEQDTPLVLRAVQDLKNLTEEVRKVAKFQEDHGKIFEMPLESLITDIELLQFFGHQHTYSLNQLLKRKNIFPKRINYLIMHPHANNPKYLTPEHSYLVSDIDCFFSKRINHNALQHNNEIILKTSDLLAIRFTGSFGYYYKEKISSIIKLLPGRITTDQINIALGARSNDSKNKQKSVFERRGFKEADGSNIKISSHQFRHWKNTLYDLAGMSNVNQALAMGRQNFTQNKVYQHPTFEEYTDAHKGFVNFSTYEEKISFLHNGIREKTILGEFTDTYHSLKMHDSLENAEIFLNTHANALHITPFGACTHDFSLSPCPKHLECWNACSNLHLTGQDNELNNLESLILVTEKALEKIIQNSTNEFGADKWISNLEFKLNNMKNAKKLAVKGSEIRLFPEGKDLSGLSKKTDIINGKD